MVLKNKYRVFSCTVGWADGIFLFSDDIIFKEILLNTHTHFLKQSNYIGIYEFDETFLSLFNIKYINNKKYFYLYSYEKDNTYVLKQIKKYDN